MPHGEIVIDNAREVAPVNGNASDALINETERQAMAESMTVRAEAGRVAGEGSKPVNGESEGSLLAGAIAEGALPGLGAITKITEFVSDRGSDMAAHGLSKADRGSARTMEETIRDAKRAPGSYGATADNAGPSIVARVNNMKDFFTGKTATDFASASMTGGLGKKNAMHIPADESTTAGLNQSKKTMEAIFGKELTHKKTLDSVHAARMERSAAIGLAKMKAPGMDMGFAPAAPTQAILHEAEEHAKTVAGTLV